MLARILCAGAICLTLSVPILPVLRAVLFLGRALRAPIDGGPEIGNTVSPTRKCRIAIGRETY